MDNTKVQYASSWNVNQILASGEVTVTLSASSYPPPLTQIATFSSGLSVPPKFTLYFKSGGRWYPAGTDLTVNGVITSNTLYAYTYNTGTYTIRYQIFTTPIGDMA